MRPAEKESASDKAECVAFEQKLVALQPKLLSMAMKLTRRLDRAEDLVQTALMKAIQNRSSFTPGTNLGAWVHVIMRNEYLDQVRRDSLARRHFLEVFARESEAESNPFPYNPDVSRELRELEEALSKLSEQERDAVLLIGTGHDYQEASDILSVPVGTVKSSVSRARAKLRTLTGRSE